MLFSRRFSRTCLEGISVNFFVCFIFNVSLGSAPKRKKFDIQRNTRVGSGGQFTSNRLSNDHMYIIYLYKHCIFHVHSCSRRPSTPNQNQERTLAAEFDLLLLGESFLLLDIRIIFTNPSFKMFLKISTYLILRHGRLWEVHFPPSDEDHPWWRVLR